MNGASPPFMAWRVPVTWATAAHYSRTEPPRVCCPGTGKHGWFSSSTPNLARTHVEATLHIKAEREEMELDFRSELFSAGSCRTCMCPWAHKGSGNAAELEEQPLRPLFLLLFPPFCVSGPSSAWNRPHVPSQVTHIHLVHLPAGMGSRVGQMGSPETFTL